MSSLFGNHGGSVSGEVILPIIVDENLEYWLKDADDSIRDFTAEAVKDNPFETADLVSPTALFDNSLARFCIFHDKVMDQPHSFNWDEIVQNALSSLQTADVIAEIDPQSDSDLTSDLVTAVIDKATQSALSAINQNVIDDLVNAFRTSQDTDFQKTLSQFNAGMADMNAENSSAFLWGQALLYSENEKRISEFRSQQTSNSYNENLRSFIQAYTGKFSEVIRARLEENQQNLRAIIQTSGMQLQSREMALEMDMAASHLYGELTRMKIIGESEHELRRLKLMEKKRRYPIELYAAAGSAVSTHLGASAFAPYGPSDLQTAMGAGLQVVGAFGASGGAEGLAGLMTGGLG